MLVHQSVMHFDGFQRFGSRALTFAKVVVDELELRLLEGRALLIGKVSSPGSGELTNALDFLEGLAVSSSVYVHGPLLMAYTNSRTA